MQQLARRTALTASSFAALCTLAAYIPQIALAYPAPYSCTRNFYVSTTGSNIGGCGTSSGNACGSLAYVDRNRGGATALRAGDCVNVAAGTYTINETGFGAVGNANSPTGYVAWIGAPNHATILTGSCAYGLIHVNNYQIWDGFAINAPNCHSGSGTSASGYCFLNTGASHHNMILNNDISECAGGIGLGPGDYALIAGNLIHGTTDSWLSAISMGEIVLIPGFTPTLAWDTQTYHIQILDNICFNNGSGDTAHTDGECVIIDTPTTTYNGHGLIAGNVAYNNGGACIELNRANNFDVFNNSCYGNYADTADGSTIRGEIFCLGCSNSNFNNNIAYATPTSSGNQQYTAAITVWGAGGAVNTTSWHNNITRGISNSTNSGYCTTSIQVTDTSDNTGMCNTIKSNNALHDVDPLFVSATDLHLQANSQARSTGSALPTGVLPGPFLQDLDRNWFSNDSPNLGAYDAATDPTPTPQ